MLYGVSARPPTVAASYPRPSPDVTSAAVGAPQTPRAAPPRNAAGPGLVTGSGAPKAVTFPPGLGEPEGAAPMTYTDIRGTTPPVLRTQSAQPSPYWPTVPVRAARHPRGPPSQPSW